MTKKLKAALATDGGITAGGDILANGHDLRTRPSNTGGGDVLTRSLYLGPAGYAYITDTSGNRVGFIGPGEQPALFWAMGRGTGPAGGGADEFNIDLSTGEVSIGAAGQFSSSADVLSFNGPSGENVGHRAYSVKSTTAYEIWCDGVKVTQVSAGSFSLTGSFTASVNVTAVNVFARNIGQQTEVNITTTSGGAAAAVDWAANGASQRFTLTNNVGCTVTMTAPNAVGWYTLKTISPPSGTVPAITWPANVRWAGGTKPAQATTLGRANVQRFYWDGTNYWGDAIVNAA